MTHKVFFSLTVALACWLLPSSSTQAQSLYFYLQNNAGSTISKVYVSPSERSSWGSNLIPYDYVYDGSQLYIFIPNTYGRTCYFDMKVIFTDGTRWTFSDLDICSLFRITINWNGTYYTEWDY